MPNEEWGVKRVCPTTGKRFYDLNKTPIVSPYTGEVVEIDDGSRKAPGARASAAKEEKALPADIENDDDLLDDDADNDSDIDDDLLEDDDDDTVSLDDIADVGGDDDEG